MRRGIRMLFIPRESFPTDRVRINVLFGREMLSRGHEIDLVMQSAGGVPPGPRPWFGRTVWIGPTTKGGTRLHRLLRQWLGFAHDVRFLWSARGRYDALLVSDKFATASLAALIARARGHKLIFWLTFPYAESDASKARSGVARYPLLSRMRAGASSWLMYRWIMPRADHVFVQSDRMKRSVCAHGVDPKKVSSILTGFDLEGIKPVRREPRAPGPATVAYLGTLNAERRLEVLVDMLARLRRGGLDARLLLVGGSENPRDKRLLEQRATELGVLPHVEFAGFLPHAEALRRVAGADVCISPIDRGPVLDVGSPTKMIEYMALALPVVANDHPEQKQILRESRAGVCVPGSARHYARAVRWVLARPEHERAAMGARGRAYVERNRTYARIADEVERVCLDVIARPRHAAKRAHDSVRSPTRAD